MIFKSGCFSIFCLFIVIYHVDSRPQFFLNQIGDTLKKTGCKVHEVGATIFSHKKNSGTSSCTDNNDREANSNNPLVNNGQEKESSGYYNNKNSKEPVNQPSYGNDGHLAYSSTQNNPNQVGSERNANQGGAQYPSRAENVQNTGYVNNNQPTQTSNNSPNAIVYPGQVEKPKPTVYNSERGQDGRTLVNKPNQSSSNQQLGAGETAGSVKSSVTSATVTVSTSTTARSNSRKSYKNHSAIRKQYSSDYSDEDSNDGDSDEKPKKKKKILTTPPPETEEKVVGVTDGRYLIGQVKTNCREGFKADKKGRCREVY